MAKLSRIFFFALLLVLASKGIFLSVRTQKPSDSTAAVVIALLEGGCAADFSNLGATQEFARFAWEETIQALPSASRLEMPKVYFSKCSSKELGYTNFPPLLGLYMPPEKIVVIFSGEHISALGADTSFDEDISTGVISFFGKKDVQGYIGVTLVHEFKHHILHAANLKQTRHHEQMLQDEIGFQLMRRVAGSVSKYGDVFIDLEKNLLKNAIAEDMRKEQEWRATPPPI